METTDKLNIFNKTTRNISYSLLLLFTLFLIIAALGAFFAENETKQWFDLFKNGSIYLSSILTTVIGYYFGNKNIAEAEKNAQDAKVELAQLQSELQDISPTDEAYELETPQN